MKMGSRLLEILERLGGERRIHYALDHFHQCLSEAGHPEAAVKSVVIAGTNGKGSTTLFISSALVAHGYNVATFLSPHLQHPRERFLFNLFPAQVTDLDTLACKYENLAKKHALTYFEFLTLLFFVWAKERNAEYLVLEVGLGGRLDATNVTKPLAVALTNISFDHQAYLGNSLEAILSEKIAVVPEGGKLYTGVTENSLLRSIDLHCNLRKIDVSLSSEVLLSFGTRSWAEQAFLLDGHRFSIRNPSPVMVENARLAYQLLRRSFPEIPLKTIQTGFAKVKTPGRFETIQENPRVILSGDHNLAGIESLSATLRELPPSHIHTVCAFSPDKPYRKLYEMLRGISKSITLTQVQRLRSTLPDDYFTLCPDFAPNAKEAVASAIAACAKDEIVLVTGSLYLIGEVRELWKEQTVFEAS